MDNIPLGIQLPKINKEEIKICIALYLVIKKYEGTAGQDGET